MRKVAAFGLGLAALALTACGAEAPQAKAPMGGYGPSGGGGAAGYSTASNDVAPPAAMPAPPPPSPGEMSAAPESAPMEPRAENRPGLGTEWGESRESHIHEVSFFRSGSEPFAFSQLFYNDRHGVEAQAAFHPGQPTFHDVSVVGGAITVSVRDAWGSPLDALHVGERTYVVGQEGERYSIVIANHTSRRFEAVATVDGLDVINGSKGTFENRGYVLMPWASLEIDGFRKSEDEVAAFRFAKVRDSYAAQRGEDRNVGVIGVAFFAERGDDWSSGEVWRRETASPFPNDPRFAPPPR